jgi:uncharacterized membrane protein
VNDKLTLIVTWLSIGGGALSAGVFFDWSVFIMPSLNRLTASQAVISMQEMNRFAPGPFFGLALTGTTVTSAILIISSLFRLNDPGSIALLAGGVLFIVGGILVTAFANIPLNNELGGFDPSSADIARQWSDFFRSWQLWNHVRAITTFAATICFVIALRQAAD